jgi:hypothetical protein
VSIETVTRGWAKPVLDQMGLAQRPQNEELLSSLRTELERSQFLDRMRSAVTQMNREAGHQIIEPQEFLPPARLVIRLRHARGGTQYCLEIVVRPEGPKGVFYTIKKTPRGLRRIFGNTANNRISNVYSVYFRPEAVREADVQSWITFVVSEFKSKFQPEVAGYSSNESRPQAMSRAAGLLDTA